MTAQQLMTPQFQLSTILRSLDANKIAIGPQSQWTARITHIVWEDSYDRHDKYFQQPQIYYKFLEIDEASREAITAIDSTLLTPIIGTGTQTSLRADDLVQIAWDDTRWKGGDRIFD